MLYHPKIFSLFAFTDKIYGRSKFMIKNDLRAINQFFMLLS